MKSIPTSFCGHFNQVWRVPDDKLSLSSEHAHNPTTLAFYPIPFVQCTITPVSRTFNLYPEPHNLCPERPKTLSKRFNPPPRTHYVIVLPEQSKTP